VNDDDRRDRGMKVRREVLGDEHVDRSTAKATDLTRDFQDLITRYAWGEIWSRPGLDRRIRSCITVAMAVALNRPEELALHLRGALRNGITVDELREVLLQTAVYCGVPAAHNAFRVAEEVLGPESSPSQGATPNPFPSQGATPNPSPSEGAAPNPSPSGGG
jgi:4-carboxymuconolactone decarboxylase